jgi:hypothetical protein
MYSTGGESYPGWPLWKTPSDFHRLDIASTALNYQTREKASSNGNLTTQVRLASIS